MATSMPSTPPPRVRAAVRVEQQVHTAHRPSLDEAQPRESFKNLVQAIRRRRPAPTRRPRHPVAGSAIRRSPPSPLHRIQSRRSGHCLVNAGYRLRVSPLSEMARRPPSFDGRSEAPGWLICRPGALLPPLRRRSPPENSGGASAHGGLRRRAVSGEGTVVLRLSAFQDAEQGCVDDTCRTADA